MVCFIDYLEAVKLLFFKSAAKVQKKNDMCKLKRENSKILLKRTLKPKKIVKND